MDGNLIGAALFVVFLVIAGLIVFCRTRPESEKEEMGIVEGRTRP